MSNRSLKKGLLISLSGEALSKLPLYGFEFILASWLTLNQYAEWAAIFLILRFSPYCHFGVLSYFNKRYPLLHGRGIEAARERVKLNTNRSINYILILLCTVSICLYLSGSISLLQLIVLASLIIIQIYTYCQAKVRNDGDFKAFTIGLLLYSCAQLLVALLLVKMSGVIGAAISVFLGYFTAVIYYIFIRKVDYKLDIIKLRELKVILRLGAIPFFLTISAFFLQVADRIALILVDDKEKLAFYGFFALFMQLGIVIVNSIGKVIGPYILSLTGQKDVHSTMYISIFNSYFICIFYVFFSICCYFFGDLIITKYFSNFIGSTLGVYNYATIGFIMAVCLAFYPQLIACSKELRVIGLNIIFSLLLIFSIYFVANEYSGYILYTIISLVLNSLFALALINLIEKTLQVKLLKVSFIVVFMLSNTLLVNLYVWN